MSLRGIARLLGVNHQTVVNWIREGRTDNESDVSPAEAPQTTRTAPQHDSGKGRVTIEDVARQAGVGVSTVSNYLNNKGRMTEATRERIRSVIDTLHFTPNALVRAIRARRTRILGVLVFDLERLDERFDQAVTAPLLAGIYSAAEARGYDVLLYTGWPGRPERHSGLDFLNGHVDGMLWTVPPIETPALARVAAAGLPVVALLSRHVPPNVGYINGENIDTVSALVLRLARQGHRRIAFAAPSRRASNYEDRRTGYRRGLIRAGLRFDPQLCPEVPDTREPVAPCVRLLENWAALPNPPTAIVAVTDQWAGAIADAAAQLGLRIPQDLAITGFDNVPAAHAIGGGLTTVHQPFRMIGQRAVDLLIHLIGGASVEACRVTLPLDLIERYSTSNSV